MAKANQRGDIRTWTLLVLALLPTWAVLAGAALLWAERGQEIDEFEAALVPVEVTYELFTLTSQLLRVESSLQFAAVPGTSPEVIARAEADRALALGSLRDAEVTLGPLIDRLDPQREEMVDSQVISLLGGSLSLGIDRLEQQIVGEPVDEQLTLLVALARQSAAGTVLPFVNSADPSAGYLYTALGSTVEYHDRFDRDRVSIIDALAANELPASNLITSISRTDSWKDLTDSRLFVPVNSGIDWFGTSAAPDAPLLLDTRDPVEVSLSQLSTTSTQQENDRVFLELQELDDLLGADVDLAYAALTSESDSHLVTLHRDRRLTGLTSVLMAALAVALAGLTISEVRRRRQVEAAHSEAVEQLSEKAERDPTTGTWNRRRLESSIQRQIVQAPLDDQIVVLAYLDLDHFKAINDVWGHSTGDHVLRTVTERLGSFSYRGISFELCRFGGDEFVLSAAMENRSLAWFEGLGQAIIEAVDTEMSINGRLHEVGVSVGIAASTPGSTLDSLLLEADSSLLLAKRKRGTAVVYNRDISRTGELVHALPRAFENGEICAHIQPVVDIATGAVHHVEALARWNRSSGEKVSPAVFIPLVESYGLAEKLTTTVLGCVETLISDPTTPPSVRVWINVSPRELDVANFAERFVSMLQQLDVPPNRIGIEITESVAVRDPERLTIELRRLREVGITVAIDDFGSGYSPLGYLRFLPVDVVKLDRSLIADIHRDVANQHIVIGVVGLVHELGMQIVAEGVEQVEEQTWLAAHGVRRVQGFLFDQPMHPRDFCWDDRRVTKREPVGNELSAVGHL